MLKLNPPKQVKTTMTTMIAIDDINVDDNEYDDARKENLVEVEPGKAGADNAAKVGAALLLAETILGTEEECLRVSSDLFAARLTCKDLQCLGYTDLRPGCSRGSKNLCNDCYVSII